MRLLIGRWGIEGHVGGVVVSLYLGDVYLRCPRVGEVAWNSTGFYANRLSLTDSRGENVREVG